MGVADDLESTLEDEQLFEKGSAQDDEGTCRWQVGVIGSMAMVTLVVTLACWSSTRPPVTLHMTSPGQHGRLGEYAETADCKETGICPLWGLFFDSDVHSLVAQNLIQTGMPLLGPTDLVAVRGIVTKSFGNITTALRMSAPAVGDELNLLKVNNTVKTYILNALQIVSDPQVQNFGREVARVVRSSPSFFSDPQGLRQHIVEGLWPHLGGIQRFQAETVQWPTRSIWRWGEGHQWEMTFDVESVDWLQAISGKVSSLSAKGSPADNPATVASAALAEGRALLDILLMCIRSKGPEWDTSLHGAVDAFAEPLSAACEPEPPAARPADLEGALLCPMKFGLLGADALRFAATLEAPQGSAPCDRSGVCPLMGLLSDYRTHSEAAQSLVGLGRPALGERDEARVRGIVAVNFGTIVAFIRKHAPAAEEALKEVVVNSTLQEQLLEAMRLVADPQVQNIGRGVAEVLRSGSPLPEPELLRDHLAEGLWEQLGAIQALQAEIIPESVRQLWRLGGGQQWQVALDVEMARSREPNPSGLSQAPSAARDTAIAGGALEIGKALLEFLLMCVRTKGPAWSPALGPSRAAFNSPLAVTCDPVAEGGSDLQQALVCPLQFGLLGLDGLRFADHVFAAQEEAPCGASGPCPLRWLLFDPAVRQRAAEDIVRQAAEPHGLLDQGDMPMVQSIVAAGFRNVSAALRGRVPALAEELDELAVNVTVKRYLLDAMRLISDRHVQDVGRSIVRGIRAAPAAHHATQLEHLAERGVRRRLADVQALQDRVVQWPLREIWGWAKERQWLMTRDLEGAEELPAATGTLATQPAVAQATWEEGRTLLDLMLMCVRSRGPAWDASLGAAKAAFSRALGSRCDTEVDEGQPAGFVEALVCPMRFGMVGLDALRFSDSLPVQAVEECGKDGPCTLGALLLDPSVHEAVAADIVRAAWDPREVLGEAGVQEVRQIVERGFRNINVHVRKYSANVARELDQVEVGEGEKEQLVGALRLASDPRVQGIGREVALAIRASTDFRSPDELKGMIVERLGRKRLREIRNFTAGLVPQRLRRIWNWSASRQWDVAIDAENVNSIKASGAAAILLRVDGGAGERAKALHGAALEEGRVLLDLMLMHIRSEGPHVDTSLFPVMDVFERPLGTPCTLEEPPAGGPKGGLREKLLCPLKLGTLGVDAMRFAVSAAGPEGRAVAAAA